MTSSLRQEFALALSSAIKTMRLDTLKVKPLKSGAKLSCPGEKPSIAEIYFDYLRNAGGVYVGGSVSDGGVHSALIRLAAGERSNLLCASTMSFNSLSERFKEFSADIGGVVQLRERMDVVAACADIVARVQDTHLKKIAHFVTLDPALVEDVLQYPDHYAYPLHTIALCLKKNKVADLEAQLVTYAKRKQMPKVADMTFTARMEDDDIAA